MKLPKVFLVFLKWVAKSIRAYYKQSRSILKFVNTILTKQGQCRGLQD